MDNTCRLYTDLAWLWPMWGDPDDEYAHYCRHVTGLIKQHARHSAGTLLGIGCGGGKNVCNLKGTFRVTGVDLSPAMLAQAKDLNPECTFDLRAHTADQLRVATPPISAIPFHLNPQLLLWPAIYTALGWLIVLFRPSVPTSAVGRLRSAALWTIGILVYVVYEWPLWARNFVLSNEGRLCTRTRMLTSTSGPSLRKRS